MQQSSAKYSWYFFTNDKKTEGTDTDFYVARCYFLQRRCKCHFFLRYFAAEIIHMNRLSNLFQLLLLSFFLFTGEAGAYRDSLPAVSEACLEASDDRISNPIPAISEGENMLHHITKEQRHNPTQRERRAPFHYSGGGFCIPEYTHTFFSYTLHGLCGRAFSAVHRSVSEKCSIILLIRSIRI